ncbi:MAG: hypothetical protein A2Y87_06535 [Bacteroidetes bacterium RBG_13_46_8]|nr:MAG: hypothetical protein A2Y87_06535 [Bacteroidetes bacterium RBG_13_46_8]
MKTKRLFSAASAVIAALLFTTCEMDHLKPKGEYGILPERFKVDIPNSLSNTNFKSTSFKGTEADTVNGDIIYWHLNTFIAVGEAAADIVVAAIWSIHFYDIEDVIFLSYTSDEDKRVKNLEVIKDAEFRDRQWEYKLTITDAESEGNADEGLGMEIFWNTDPIEGIALFKPYNLNRKDNLNAPDAMAGIEYSEKGTGDYETFMIVEIAGLPLPDAKHEPFAMETLKMFVGKKGECVDVYGNSSHPNAQFNPNDDEAIGFNWAFVASGNDSKDIAVAEVGLPFNRDDISERDDILVENSIKKVLTRELTNYVVSQYAKLGLTLNPDEVALLLAPYLKNADAPGYFNASGFVQGGMAPNNDYETLESNIEEQVPYNPLTISNLEISFK